MSSGHVDADAARHQVSLIAILPADAGTKKIGPDAWLARCQFHEDRTPSMRVSLTAFGWVYFCYGCGAKGDVIRYVMETRKLRFLDALRAMGADLPPPIERHLEPRKDRDKAPAGMGGGKRDVVATYDYFDEVGELLYQVVRFAPKGFAQRQPHPFGGWRWTMAGARRVLYRLPDLLASPPSRPVVIVEGEKDADNLAVAGRIATTNVGGAGKWRPEYAQHLRGRHVVIVPDNDAPGLKHAEEVRATLSGAVESVRVHMLPAGVKDASDWLAMKALCR